jgi:hypothetical protein
MDATPLSLIGESEPKKSLNASPLYASQPAAGFPAPGDDLIERPLDLNDLLVKNPTLWRVRGYSMVMCL